jgi:hypothetical protein
MAGRQRTGSGYHRPNSTRVIKAELRAIQAHSEDALVRSRQLARDWRRLQSDVRGFAKRYDAGASPDAILLKLSLLSPLLHEVSDNASGPMDGEYQRLEATATGLRIRTTALELEIKGIHDDMHSWASVYDQELVTRTTSRRMSLGGLGGLAGGFADKAPAGCPGIPNSWKCEEVPTDSRLWKETKTYCCPKPKVR